MSQRAQSSACQSTSSGEVCLLCGSKQLLARYTTYFRAWGEKEKKFVEKHLEGTTPLANSTLCKKHLVEAQRHHSEPNYIPKWKAAPKALSKCINPKCNHKNEKIIKPHFESIEKLEEVLGVQSTEDNPFMLCQDCYNDLYRMFNPRLITCASCGAIPKSGTEFMRHSPDAKVMSEHLQSMTGSDITILPTDVICSTCYKLHLTLTRSKEQEAESTIECDVQKWRAQIEEGTDTLTEAVFTAVLYVAERLTENKALLLPEVSRVFLEAYGITHFDSIQSLDLPLEVGNSTVQFSSRWVLSQLIIYLKPYMHYKCVHKKFGTVLYKKGGDLLTSLSWALGALSSYNESFRLEESTGHERIRHHRVADADKAILLTEASYVLNDIIHNEIKKASTLDDENPLWMNIDQYLENVDPILLDFIASATSTVRHQTHNRLSHVKKVRQYFIICLLLHCTNPKQTHPLQNLLADAVEVCGGSRQLLKLLNRLGCVSSPDTHDRFVTHHAVAKRQRSIWDDLPKTVFTIASVDNFDMLQSYAAVYCGDQCRSYHGTTVQLVQPMAHLEWCSHTESHISTLPEDNIPHREHTSMPDPEPSPAHQLRRPCSNSPASSPHKLGKEGPKRRRTVSVRKLSISEAIDRAVITSPTQQSPILEGFMESTSEADQRKEMQLKLFFYTLQKYLAQKLESTSKLVLKDVRQFLRQIQATLEQPSQVYYMELVNENPDSDETMAQIADDLIEKFSVVPDSSVILVGDGKTYEHLMNIKRHYGHALSKLLIFPGDWHTLKNFQPVLMKVYYNAGLKELAQASGYRGTTLCSLQSCSNFKRTHCFLLHVWEALYRKMIAAYTKHTDQHDVLEAAKCMLSSAIEQSRSPEQVMDRIEELICDANVQSDFIAFVEDMAVRDDTWRFWKQFVLVDCFSYIGLYLAIRGSNWNLRVSSLKQMAPLFAAFDRDTYQRIIPHHLADLQRYPLHVMQCLEAGGFTVTITPGDWHAVAFDEAHEMCVNKDMKAAVIRPTQAYLQKTSLFFNYRMKAYKNLVKQLFPEVIKETNTGTTIIDITDKARRTEENIVQMCAEIGASNLFSNELQSNRGLVNVFTGKTATHQQSHDMLTFREIGNQAFKDYVIYRILMHPSPTNAPIRRKKLVTMATVKKDRKRGTPKERELKQVNKCLRRKLAWCSRNNVPFDSSQEQYSLLPRALADENGIPHKASKSTWTEKIENRYKSAQPNVITHCLPEGWHPEVAILDAMFLINTRPLRQTKTIADYANLLFNRFVLEHFQMGAQEVHILFDKPNTMEFDPKVFEHTRRDNDKSKSTHKHTAFSPTTPTPQPWRDYIECRECKRSIVEAIGLSLLQKGQHMLCNTQKMIVAGCFTGDGADSGWILHGPDLGTMIAAPDGHYLSNASEADARIWRHATQTWANRVLIYSPDTDVYKIGLGLIDELTSKEYIVQINVPHAAEKKFLSLNNLNLALQRDTDLARVPNRHLACILQSIYISTGCDYISYFKSMGKATILNVFFQYAEFVCGMTGSLHDTGNTKQSFLSFLRLIGCCYFKKHLAAFVSLYNCETPLQLYNSFNPSLPCEERHELWVKSISKTVSDRILHEEERMPSQTALWRHWLRSCWVSNMWRNSHLHDLYSTLPRPEESGWLRQPDGSFSIDWEAPEVLERIESNINFLLKGCGCRKGCKSKSCGCRKKEIYCGPACECQGCCNTPVQQDDEDDDDNSDSSSVTSASSRSDNEISDLETEVETEVITDDFSFSIETCI